MKHSLVAGALALSAAAFPATARADDPFDPDMQTEQAREHDRAMIRKLNRDMLAQVQARDALYAAVWRAYREMPQAQADYRRRLAAYEREQDRYAQDRQRYEQAMARWRRDVADCRAGDFAACD
jgi:hypothetical protein